MENILGYNCVMSILSHNGGAILAMCGKDCVAIASDLRFGVGAQTVATGENHYAKIVKYGPRLMCALPGLVTDSQTVSEKIKFRLGLYELKEGRRISPKAFASMVSHMLYERRFSPFFIEPIIAGLDQHTLEPYVCGADLIGCLNAPGDFVVGGTCTTQLYGMCEAVWEPGLGPDELYETAAQALMNAVDRDASSGWGAVVHVIEKDKVTTRYIKTRMD